MVELLEDIGRLKVYGEEVVFLDGNCVALFLVAFIMLLAANFVAFVFLTRFNVLLIFPAAALTALVPAVLFMPPTALVALVPAVLFNAEVVALNAL
jgi:hypothetical protein